MNKFNNYDTFDHYLGQIWISKMFEDEKRGNICLFQNDDFRVLAYISPDQIENKPLEKVIYDTLQANGTLWMLNDESSIICAHCGYVYREDNVNIVDYEEDICVYCESQKG